MRFMTFAASLLSFQKSVSYVRASRLAISVFIEPGFILDLICSNFSKSCCLWSSIALYHTITLVKEELFKVGSDDNDNIRGLVLIKHVKCRFCHLRSDILRNEFLKLRVIFFFDLYDGCFIFKTIGVTGEDFFITLTI